MADVSKKTFNFTIFFVGIYVIVAIIVLVVIWWPKKTEELDKRINYEAVNDGESKCLNLYLTTIRYYLKDKNSSDLFKKIDKAFLEKNNLNENNFKSYLMSSNLIGENPILKESSISRQGDNIYIYRINYLVNGYSRYVNIIETFPYEYTISFEQDTLPIVNNSSGGLNTSITKSNTKITNIDNIKYEVSKTTIRENGITYKIKITNNSDKNIKYNFDNITNVSVVLSDGKEANLGGAVISSDEDLLTPNSYLEKELFFSVTSLEQNKIKSIKIQNVKIGDEKKTININV